MPFRKSERERSIQASASGKGVQRALALWRGSGPALGPVPLGGATGLRADGQGAGTGRLIVEPRNGPRSAACPPAKGRYRRQGCPGAVVFPPASAKTRPAPRCTAAWAARSVLPLVATLSTK